MHGKDPLMAKQLLGTSWHRVENPGQEGFVRRSSGAPSPSVCLVGDYIAAASPVSGRAIVFLPQQKLKTISFPTKVHTFHTVDCSNLMILTLHLMTRYHCVIFYLLLRKTVSTDCVLHHSCIAFSGIITSIIRMSICHLLNPPAVKKWQKQKQTFKPVHSISIYIQSISMMELSCQLKLKGNKGDVLHLSWQPF